jgi:hypothetical protein
VKPFSFRESQAMNLPPIRALPKFYRLNEEQKAICMRIGFALILVQHVEALLEFSLGFVLPKIDPRTIERLFDQKKSGRKVTLGLFLRELRKRAELEDTFDDLLASFLENRSVLAHHVAETDSWNLNSGDGLKMATYFVDGVIAQAGEIRNVLLALIVSWREEVRREAPVPQNLDQIRATYSRLVNHIFFEEEEPRFF